MGEVYKATDTRLNRVVALKILSPGALADPQLHLRFEREARAIGALSFRRCIRDYVYHYGGASMNTLTRAGLVVLLTSVGALGCVVAASSDIQSKPVYTEDLHLDNFVSANSLPDLWSRVDSVVVGRVEEKEYTTRRAGNRR